MAKKKLPTWATTVTPFSKYLALSMLVILPILAFFYGTYYQRQIDLKKPQQRTYIFNVLPTKAPSTSPSPDGTISCHTNADCQPGYSCVQAGPIRIDSRSHKTCWKNGHAIPM